MQTVNLYPVTHHSFRVLIISEGSLRPLPQSWTSIHTTAVAVIILQWPLALSKVNCCPRGSGTPCIYGRWMVGGGCIGKMSYTNTHTHTPTRMHTRQQMHKSTRPQKLAKRHLKLLPRTHTHRRTHQCAPDGWHV